MNVTLKQGNTAPALRHKLGIAGDLTDATAAFTMVHNRRVVVDRADADIEDGHAVYQWKDGDTDTAGVLKGEFTVTYANGTRETDPETGYIQITIERSLSMADDTTTPEIGDARGIVSAVYSEATGIVTFSYTDGTTSKTGDLRGEDGEPGQDGAPGKDGVPGKDGAPGTPGTNATITTFTTQAAYDAYTPTGPLDLAVLTNA